MQNEIDILFEICFGETEKDSSAEFLRDDEGGYVANDGHR